MNRIRIISPGMQSTVQDLGRYGWAHCGVSAAGAADALALRTGNLLVGNPENAAAIEMTLTGATFEFEAPAVVALTGADFQSGLPTWVAVEVRAGDSIRCRAARVGARGYLCVRGGIDAPKIMGSASVHLTTGIGGGALKASDMLAVGNAALRKARFQPVTPPVSAGPLRVTAGPQADLFGTELYRARYLVREDSNRMGIRLEGPAIVSPAGQMLTEGVGSGAIQIPPAGQPIILFVDHQTTGGYPKPANVISADLWRVGQLRPRDAVEFERIEMEQALRLLQQQEQWLYALL